MEDTSQSPAAVDADGAQHEFFGENTSEPDSPTTKKQASLSRLTFKTSRQIEFCSRKELAAQTGHSESQWPLVILKELMDNAIDAAEGIVVTAELIVPPCTSRLRFSRTPVTASARHPPRSARRSRRKAAG